MKRFIQGEHRGQSTLLPESLDDYVSDSNPVRVVDVFVDELDLITLGFESAVPAETGRPAYHPAVMLKIYIYGYLNRIQLSRRLEREAQRKRRADVAYRSPDAGFQDHRQFSQGQQQSHSRRLPAVCCAVSAVGPFRGKFRRHRR
jgi:transposase